MKTQAQFKANNLEQIKTRISELESRKQTTDVVNRINQLKKKL